MKMTRKLIPAIAMLLISAVMMSTASFAWFSMNTSVSAKGMQITAKNESKYLQIVAGANTEFDSTAQTEATAVTSSNVLRPTALVAAITDEGAGFTPYAGSTSLIWIEAFSNDPDKTDKAPTNKYLDVTSSATATEKNFYTLYNIFQVRMNPTTGVADGGALSVTSVTVKANDVDGATKLLPAVRVAIIGTKAGAIYNSAGTLVSGNATIMDKVTTDASQIQVFVYFDGEDAAAITNNVVANASYSVEFTLSIA